MPQPVEVVFTPLSYEAIDQHFYIFHLCSCYLKGKRRTMSHIQTRVLGCSGKSKVVRVVIYTTTVGDAQYTKSIYALFYLVLSCEVCCVIV